METREAYEILDKKIDALKADSDIKFATVFKKLDSLLEFKWKMIGKELVVIALVSAICSALTRIVFH